MGITIYRFIIFSVFILSATVSAEGLYEQSMSSGMASYEKKDFAAAEEAFRAALRDSPDDYRATLYLGMVLNRGDSKEAASLLKKALGMNPLDPAVNLNLGIYYYQKAVYPEARDYFETTAEVAPNTEYSVQADQYLAKMKERGPKPWSLDAAFGMQYDSNVILGPDNAPLPGGISRKSDWLAVLYLKGQYDFLLSEGFRSGVSYSIYQNLHSRLSDFNITQQVAGLNSSYELSRAVTLTGSYAFEYVLVGGDTYDHMHTLTPALVFNYGKGFTTTIDYGYSNFHFSDSGLFPDNSDRTGFNHRVGVSEFMPVADFLDVRAGYAFDKEKTRKDFWAYSGNKVFAALTFKPCRGLTADMYGEYYNKDYDGISPVSGTRRSDNVHTYSLTLTKRLSDAVSLAIGQAYIRNQSNIPVFDYKRAITSAFITARF